MKKGIMCILTIYRAEVRDSIKKVSGKKNSHIGFCASNLAENYPSQSAM